MLTLKEKLYMLKLLKKQRRKFLFFGYAKKDSVHDQLVEKLEQMVRNESVNKEHL
ncbi:hypothetical protein [Paenibacillus sp. HB172176]|uniref:hypothetical protein n=1 Tax=Paenibacillus sp. HB172176 TaxID=2493690 RepID=UPI00143BDE0A|nr:hypothetical protein [Paenibacillus sp. HB172176]